MILPSEADLDRVCEEQRIRRITRKPIATRKEKIEGQEVTVHVYAPAGLTLPNTMLCRDDSHKPWSAFKQAENRRFGPHRI